MLKQLKVLFREGYESRIWYNDSTGHGFFIGDLDIDGDGGKNIYDDPSWQPNTSLRYKGKSIDSHTVPGMVLPLGIPDIIKPIVLGCKGRITNLDSGQLVDCVTFDFGPPFKDGEASCAAAVAIGVNPNARNGGDDRPIFLYEFWAGVAALVNGIQYELQPWGK